MQAAVETVEAGNINLLGMGAAAFPGVEERAGLLPDFYGQGTGSAFQLDSEAAVFLEYHKVAGHGAGEEVEGALPAGGERPEAADGNQGGFIDSQTEMVEEEGEGEQEE